MKSLAPYQIFFPIGILSALIAVGVWLIQDTGWLPLPAILIHSKLIFGGFLWSFIVGFLMTAVPRMTGATKAHAFEYMIALLLIGSLICFSWKIDPRWFYGAMMALILFLLLFAGRRLLKSTKPIPVFFSHVGLGMVSGLLGAYCFFEGQPLAGFHLFNVGAILFLILGIGTRFFSFLSGLPSEFESQGAGPMRWLFHGLGILTLGLLILAGKGYSLAYLGLTLTVLIYMIGVWKVFRPSQRPSALKYGVRVAASVIPLSFLLSWLFPLQYIAWFHLLFIGCFALMTFSVATRVTLAHGSYPVDLEMKTPTLWWMVTLLALTITCRILYSFTDLLVKKSFLHLAGTFWMVAIILWCSSFLMRIWKSGKEAKPAC